MKYVKIPEPVIIQGMINSVTNEQATMSLHNYLVSYIYGMPVWRSSKEMYNILIKMQDEFGKAGEPGKWAGFSNDEWDKIFPVLTMRGEKIDQPHLAVSINKIIGCFFDATEEKPEEYAE